ncbi:MAG TPA: GSCFA domain-containing protein, partial [Methylomirabilota bacterium]|nr:GSCFA domain-containing protein [Methylomirabilota bacterium]
MSSPYDNLPSERFWRTGVAEQQPSSVQNLYRKRFALGPQDRIATAGSCFAQHIARNLSANGHRVLDAEPAPRGMSSKSAHRFGYGVYSARYGNIYHTRRLLQLVQEVKGRFQPEDWIWEKNGRWYDALRPGVEPDGLATKAEVVAMRAAHLIRVKKLFKEMTVFVFTMGLTEAWVHRPSGTVYPLGPGTLCGEYDPGVHAFVNFTHKQVVDDFSATRELLRSFNPNLK